MGLIDKVEVSRVNSCEQHAPGPFDEGKPNQEGSREVLDCDYTVTDYRPADRNEDWQAWDVTDEETTIAIEGRAPDDLCDLVEKETPYDAIWRHEGEATKVVEIRQYWAEKTAVYLDEAPRNQAVNVKDSDGLNDLLEKRDVADGIDPHQLEGAWYFPNKNDAAAAFDTTDDADETLDTWKTIKNLTQAERDMVLTNDVDLPGEGEVETHDRAKSLIEENSWSYGRRAGILAAMYLTDEPRYKTINNIISDPDFQTNGLTKCWYQYQDRAEEVVWEIRNIWPHIPEERMTPTMQELLEELDKTGDLDRPIEWNEG